MRGKRVILTRGIMLGHASDPRLIAIEDHLLRICIIKDARRPVGIPCCESSAWEAWFGPSITDHWASCKLAVSKNLSDSEILHAERQCDDAALANWTNKRGFVPEVSSDLFNVGSTIEYFSSFSRL